MSKYIHVIIVTAVLLEHDQILNINAVDKKGYEGEYLVEYPDGKKAIISAEVFDKEFHKVADDFEYIPKLGFEDAPELTDEEEAASGSKTGSAEFLDTPPAAVIKAEEKPSENGVFHEEEKPVE